MRVYYNEIDPKAAAWLRELMRAGAIPAGDVDERSITDVRGSNVAGYDQCHFFAGIGGWAYALELADWSGPIWTGSCPCQPFSQAGKGQGTDDARHLWPELRRLVAECRPPVVAGEQVASKAGRTWLSAVRTDLEDLGYAVGAADLCAAGVQAPHIRQRLWWIGALAHASVEGRGAQSERSDRADGRTTEESGRLRDAGVALGDASISRLQERVGDRGVQSDTLGAFTGQAAQCGSDAGELGDSGRSRSSEFSRDGAQSRSPWTDWDGAQSRSPWTDYDWIPCRDGKWRPVEPGTFPLAHGLPARVGRLRGYGNAIIPHVAAEFLRAYQEIR